MRNVTEADAGSGSGAYAERPARPIGLRPREFRDRCAHCAGHQEFLAGLEGIQQEVRDLMRKALELMLDAERAMELLKPWFELGDGPRGVTAQDLAQRLTQIGPSIPQHALPPEAVDSDTVDACPHGVGCLTRREREVLSLLAAGHSTKGLANRLQISQVTARNHIQHIYQKLGVHSRAEAVGFAFREGVG